MSDACFIADLGPATSDDQPLAVGDLVEITGSEAHHAAVVRRIEVGESVLVTNGQGLAVRGPVVGVAKRCVQVRVAQTLRSAEHAHRWVAVQALAKGDRADRAVETLTEMGADEIIAWQASRSISRWSVDKRDKGVAKWQATAREATKQSRRFTIPPVRFATTKQICQRIRKVERTFVLHESAGALIDPSQIPAGGEVMLIVGPEGGISPDELDAFVDAGALPILVSDGVLRTSTAGVVGLAQLRILAGD